MGWEIFLYIYIYLFKKNNNGVIIFHQTFENTIGILDSITSWPSDILQKDSSRQVYFSKHALIHACFQVYILHQNTNKHRIINSVEAMTEKLLSASNFSTIAIVQRQINLTLEKVKSTKFNCQN